MACPSMLIGDDGNHNGGIGTVSATNTDVPNREEQRQCVVKQECKASPQGRRRRRQRKRQPLEKKKLCFSRTPCNLMFIIGLAVSVVSTTTWIVISFSLSASPKDETTLLLQEQLRHYENNNYDKKSAVQNPKQDGGFILRPFAARNQANSNKQRIVMQEGKRLRNCTNPEYYPSARNKISPTFLFRDTKSSVQRRKGIVKMNNDDSSFESVFKTCPLSPFLAKDLRFQQFDYYFHQMVQVLDEKYRSECQSEIMVFGMALGDKHFELIRTKNRIISNCQVWIVLESALYKYRSIQRRIRQNKNSSNISQPIHPSYKENAPWWLRTKQGVQLLVVQEADFSPFRNLRRTVKLFKMNPHKLFPWAQRFLWVDAKLEFPSTHKNQPAVDWYFNFTIGNQPPPRDITKDKKNNTSIFRRIWNRWNLQSPPSNQNDPSRTDDGNAICGTVVSIPRHPTTMYDPSKIRSIRYAHHCAAVLQAFEYRPTVSDSFSSIEEQCQVYLQQLRNNRELSVPSSKTLEPSTLLNNATSTTTNQNNTGYKNSVWLSWESDELDSTVIDSAVLAWDLRTTRCRQFISNLLCTWLQENHCFSDRDQLGFGYALYKQQEPQQQATPSSTKTKWHGSRDQTPTRTTEEGEEEPLRQFAWRATSGRINPNTLFFTPELKHRVLMDSVHSPSSPLLFFVKSHCHWYWSQDKSFGLHSLFECLDPSPPQQKSQDLPAKDTLSDQSSLVFLLLMLLTILLGVLMILVNIIIHMKRNENRPTTAVRR